MVGTSLRSTLRSRITNLLPIPLRRLLGRRKRPKGSEGPLQTLTRSTDTSSSPSPTPPTPALPPKTAQNEPQSCHDVAKRLKSTLPQNLSWLSSGDVEIIDPAPFASGSFSDVWKGSIEGRIVAVKSSRCYSTPDFDPAEIGVRFFKEVWASRKLWHPNVVPFLGVYSTLAHPFGLLYEMMENGDLGEYLTQHPNVSRAKLLTDVSRGLEYMHSQDFIHGNVKIRNVLVDGNGVARLGGLGSAFALSLPVTWSDPSSEKLFCGIAPELIDPHAFGFVHARITKATDMFAFSMLAWEVFAGKQPFAGKVEAAIIFSVFHGDRPARPDHPEVTNRVWNVIQKCWSRDPFIRMTAADVLGVFEATSQRTPATV